MKKIEILILSFIAMFVMASCSPLVYSGYVVESYGVPYYSGNVLVYYQYQGMYYYPYYHNGVCRYKVQRQPIPAHRPAIPRHNVTNRRPNVVPQPSRRPTATPNRRPNTNTRPNVQARPSNNNITRFGGRR